MLVHIHLDHQLWILRCYVYVKYSLNVQTRSYLIVPQWQTPRKYLPPGSNVGQIVCTYDGYQIDSVFICISLSYSCVSEFFRGAFLGVGHLVYRIYTQVIFKLFNNHRDAGTAHSESALPMSQIRTHKLDICLAYAQTQFHQCNQSYSGMALTVCTPPAVHENPLFFQMSPFTATNFSFLLN